MSENGLLTGLLELEEKEEVSNKFIKKEVIPTSPTTFENIKDIDYSRVNSVLSRNSYSNFKTIKKTKVRKYIINSVELATLALILLTSF